MGRSIAIPVAGNRRAVNVRLDNVDRLHRCFPQHAYYRETLGKISIRFFLLALRNALTTCGGTPECSGPLDHLGVDQTTFCFRCDDCSAFTALSGNRAQNMDWGVFERPSDQFQFQFQGNLTGNHEDR